MKRHSTLLLLLIGVLIISGCKGNTNGFKIDEIESSQNQISIGYINFNDEEYSILKAAGSNNQMIFSINYGNEKVNNITYWIDHYINGELIESLMNMETRISNVSESKDIKIYFTTSEFVSKQEIWTLALRQGGNVSSGKYEIKSIDFDSTITYPLDEISTGLNEIVDLGMLIRNKGKNAISSSDDVERTIKENNEVYVLRCRID
ncbi:hypothetical protein M6D81_31300 [Paenibacillus sp. J5C_2022]|uniref:hypothetical protein n=1 Tax=Paenibacillus sp. J5C2022 TaxID=2977129 RepID=UPI0021D22E2E|nr:hypothetical protein [Paenibacillus sp. J5C2022]MCU6713194.1 hypothetical protein [Paenibacillus sp. J5C2022]